MNKTKNNWILKFILPEYDYVRTVYEDGLVYGKELNEKIGILKTKELDIIKTNVNEILPFLKQEGIFKQRPFGSIIKINDNSRNHRSLKIVGWREEGLIFNILNNDENYSKLFN